MRKSIGVITALMTALTVLTANAGGSVFSAEPTAAVSSESMTGKGVFSGGAEYSFNTYSGVLIIDGKGSFTVDEFDLLISQSCPNTLVICKDVIVPKNEKLPDTWMMRILGNCSPFAVYMYKDSDAWVKYQEILNYISIHAAADGKLLMRGLTAESVPVYKLDEDCDPHEEFGYPDFLIERGKEMTEYLIENGIEESRAAKITSFYLIGLWRRVDNERANADGTELNETTLEYYQGLCYRAAITEQDLANSDEEFSNFDNYVTQFLFENGITGDKAREMTQSYATGTKALLAQDMSVHDEEPTIEISEAEGVDGVVKQRTEIMREYIKKFGGGNQEIIDEVLSYYSKGLKLRIENGIAKPDGAESNVRTGNAYKRLCCQCYTKIYRLEGGLTDADRVKYEKAQLAAYKNTLCSDYSLDTEDSKHKHLTAEGYFVEYSEFNDNDGVLHEGVQYFYDPETKAVFIDGNGTFTEDDAVDIEHGLDIKAYILGKDIKLGGTMKYFMDYDYSLWFVGRISDKEHDMYLYQGSDAERLYNIYLNEFMKTDFYSTQLPHPCKSISTLRSYFAVTMLNDNIDPYTVLHGKSSITPTPKYRAQAAKDKTVIKAEPTLLGDVDFNGLADLTDLIIISKYNLNNVIYPLLNLTAIANGDMNRDGIVNTIDCSVMIEHNLGIR